MKNNKKILVIGLSSLIITSNLGLAFAATTKNGEQTKENRVNKWEEYGGKHIGCHRRERGLLKESVDELQLKGSLSSEDVKKIDEFMNQEREAMRSKLEEKIYKDECEKIDKMISEKIITKEQGNKLKLAIKQNLECCK